MTWRFVANQSQTAIGRLWLCESRQCSQESRRSKGTFTATQLNWTELNSSSRTDCSQSASWRWRAWPITRRINRSACCLLQVSSVRFSLVRRLWLSLKFNFSYSGLEVSSSWGFPWVRLVPWNSPGIGNEIPFTRDWEREWEWCFGYGNEWKFHCLHAFLICSKTVFCHRASVHQAAKLVAALLRVVMVTAGLELIATQTNAHPTLIVVVKAASKLRFLITAKANDSVPKIIII